MIRCTDRWMDGWMYCILDGIMDIGWMDGRNGGRKEE